jgi:putative membrane protein insertion efficiency factor
MNEATPASVAPIPHHHHDHDHDHEEEWHSLPPWRPRYAPSPVAWAALFMIGLYRRVFSPVMPPACRFLPTCSAYGYEAIARYGILSGGRLALWRILRCNPFGGSGYDPVP